MGFRFPDLLLAQQLVYRQLGFECSKPIEEPESAEYNACTFKIGQLFVRYRAAKITPTKTGLFVTLWKRNGNGPIQPFDIKDDLDIAMISARHGDKFGLFIFSKAVLHQRSILSNTKKEGKRGFRVYPPWDITSSNQARKTQLWQSACFLEIANDDAIDLERAKNLLTMVIF